MISIKRLLKQFKVDKTGFTLIEMIVVIAIIGILAAILVPSMVGYLETARNSRKEANVKTVYTATQAAVTALESTTPVASDTYTTTITIQNNKPENSVVSKTTNNNVIGKTLFEKVQSLIGESNYAKFSEIKVQITDGAVDGISVKEKGETDPTTYPKDFTFTP